MAFNPFLYTTFYSKNMDAGKYERRCHPPHRERRCTVSKFIERIVLISITDDLPVSQFGAIFQAAGMDTLSYTPPAAVVPATQWPTLGSLIDNGTRLVTFMDAEADFTSVPYIINEFTNVWETEFDVTDTTFDCNVNRTKGDPSTEMYLINHFLDQLVFGQPAPDVSQANVTNGVSGVGSLGQQVATCQASQGRNPNFMLVDVS